MQKVSPCINLMPKSESKLGRVGTQPLQLSEAIIMNKKMPHKRWHELECEYYVNPTIQWAHCHVCVCIYVCVCVYIYIYIYIYI
jgi:hypothetical protein